LEKIEHKVPKVPFIVKGVEYDPEDIVRFNGKELLFIADARPGASEMIVLEDKSVWSSFLQTNILATLLVRNGTVLPHESRTWDIPEMTPAVTPKLPQSVIDEAGDSIGGQAEIDAAERQKQAELENKKWQREKEAKRQREGGGVSPTGMGGGNSSATGEGGVIIIGNGENKRWGKPTTENVTLYSDTWWTGYDLKLAPGDLYNNLAKVSLMGILGWTWDDWNDEVESISPTFMCCIFGDHVGFEGSRLVFNYTRYGYPDLEQIGWKERISSVWNYGSTDPPEVGWWSSPHWSNYPDGYK
jgi:hypothetical protein